MKEILILDYQEGFADNLSCYAYGKILEKNSDKKCYYPNITSKRNIFEKEMSNFALNYEYLSVSRVEEIAKKAYLANNINLKSIGNLINKKNSNEIINLPKFRINDIDFIDDNLINELKFKTLDFIVNHDILDDILNSNSIGIYISPKDYTEKNIDYKYLKNAIKRLNKYIKSPKLYIFSKNEINFESDIEYKVVNIDSLNEEFYFLSSCKHKIILNSPNSYSFSFWASVLNDKFYSYKIYKKDNCSKYKKNRWIGV